MLSLTHGSSVEEHLVGSPEIRNRGYFFGWLTSSALLLGFFALGSGQPYLLPIFLTIGYSVVLFAFVRAIRIWRDIFNPLCLVLVIGFIRFSCPGFLLLSGVEPPAEIGLFFQLMRLSDGDWQWGHALALTGLLAVVLGWILVPGRWVNGKRLNFHLAGGVKYAALAGMIVGAAALLIFIRGNASLDVVMSGDFRGTTVREGTGNYLYLGYMLMASSVLLSAYLLTRNGKWISLVPVIVAALLYWVLGGRARAITPLASGLVLLWYVSREQRGWDRLAFKPVHTLLAPVSILCAVWVLHIGDLYRGGWGIRAFPESLSLSGLWGYITGSIFMELGQLHSLAGAFAIGPGVLAGLTFIGSLSWPLEKLLPVPGRSAGIFIVETLMGFDDDRRWGLNASLIGDAYLNFGLVGVAIVMVLFGMLLKLLYVKFREGILQSPVYALALLHGLQIFWASIDVWPQTLTVMAFTLFVILLGNTIFQVRSAEI
jgi:oligosaccharide repeat unit polymerase